MAKNGLKMVEIFLGTSHMTSNNIFNIFCFSTFSFGYFTNPVFWPNLEKKALKTRSRKYPKEKEIETQSYANYAITARAKIVSYYVDITRISGTLTRFYSQGRSPGWYLRSPSEFPYSVLHLHRSLGHLRSRPQMMSQHWTTKGNTTRPK